MPRGVVEAPFKTTLRSTRHICDTTMGRYFKGFVWYVRYFYLKRVRLTGINAIYMIVTLPQHNTLMRGKSRTNHKGQENVSGCSAHLWIKSAIKCTSQGIIKHELRCKRMHQWLFGAAFQNTQHDARLLRLCSGHQGEGMYICFSTKQLTLPHHILSHMTKQSLVMKWVVSIAHIYVLSWRISSRPRRGNETLSGS